MMENFYSTAIKYTRPFDPQELTKRYWKIHELPGGQHADNKETYAKDT